MLKVIEYIDEIKLFKFEHQEGYIKKRGVTYIWDPSIVDVSLKDLEHGYMNFFIISNNQQNDFKKVVCKLSCVWDGNDIETENDYYNFCVDIHQKRIHDNAENLMREHLDLNMLISKIGSIDIIKSKFYEKDILFV